jgi:hypothetical protein
LKNKIKKGIVGVVLLCKGSLFENPEPQHQSKKRKERKINF